MKRTLSILCICTIAAAASLMTGCKEEECCGSCGKEAAAACTKCPEGKCVCAAKEAVCTKCPAGECKCEKE